MECIPMDADAWKTWHAVGVEPFLLLILFTMFLTSFRASV